MVKSLYVFLLRLFYGTMICEFQKNRGFGFSGSSKGIVLLLFIKIFNFFFKLEILKSIFFEILLISFSVQDK